MAHILHKVPILCRSAFHKNIISNPIKNIFVLRNYENIAGNTNAWTEKKYKLQDNISDNYRLVYREQTAVSGIIITTYHAGWIGLVTGILTFGYLIFKNPPIQEKKEEEDEPSRYGLKPLTTLERVLMLLVSFTVCIILIVGSKTIPFRIYYNSTDKVYKAVFVNRIFGKKQIETFGEHTVVPVFSRKSLGDILFKINGRIILLDKECFPVPDIRERMLKKTE